MPGDDVITPEQYAKFPPSNPDAWAAVGQHATDEHMLLPQVSTPVLQVSLRAPQGHRASHPQLWLRARQTWEQFRIAAPALRSFQDSILVRRWGLFVSWCNALCDGD